MSHELSPEMLEMLARDGRKGLIEDECTLSRWLVTDNLRELHLFLGTLEDFIETEEKREVEALAPHANGGDFWAENYPCHWQDIMGSHLRQSFVVSLISATEFHLGHLCRDTAAIVQSPISHDDLKGKLLAQARKFLFDFGKFSAPIERTWELIGDIYTLRNAIVHNASMVDGSRQPKRLVTLTRRAPGISISSNFLEIKREFCIYTHDLVESFFKELHEQQVALCRRASKFSV